MESPRHFFTKALSVSKENGLLTVCYALLSEALLLGYLGFAALFTIETLLPTFVTVRLSLTKVLFVLILLSFLLAALGRFLNLSFPFSLDKKSPLLWLGLLWMVAILAVSLLKFPLVVIVILIAGFLFIGYLFSQIFFGKND